jgi:hypothetical protein
MLVVLDGITLNVISDATKTSSNVNVEFTTT